MKNEQPPKASEPNPADELNHLDQMLSAEDPNFAKSLEAVKAVQLDQKIEIESTPVDESMMPAASKDSLKIRITYFKRKLLIRSGRAKLFFKSQSLELLKKTVIFLRTRPKEFGFYVLFLVRETTKILKAKIKAFQDSSRIYKLMFFGFLGLMALSVWVLNANFRGTWLPHLHEPILTNLATQADWVEKYNPAKAQLDFYAAFPQERYEFLFKKFKVNLKRVPGYPNPMGAFEVIALLDSEETAVEVRDREVELHDLLQRTIEEETFANLESEVGKKRLKSKIMRDINVKLTQGYIREISFQTFVIKP